ncbi:MAG: acetyl-CoA decarbonylase/synthase complex subunit delta [Faecousia sp.]
MAFEPKTQAFTSSIATVTLGTGDKACKLGGVNVLPFYSFDAPIENAPKIGVEITDAGIAAYPQKGLQEFYAGCTTPAEMAKRAETMHGVSFVCLHLEGADPNGENKSVEECVELAKSVADATDLPLVIMGCKNIEKDAELFTKISEALQGKNILVLSAREENYKTVGASAALAYGQKVGAESAVDINLAKQLNVLMTQLGVAPSSIVMNAGSAAAGYGYEYVASTLDRIRAAALAQSDDQLQMPIMTPVSTETWNVKEAIMSEADMPEWGSAEERGIEMEITTASACLAGGSDAVIMRHPAAIKAIADMIEALV